jgi:pyruvyltransferase
METENKDIIKVWWAGGNTNFNYGDAMVPYLVEKMTGKKAVLTPKKGPDRVNLIIGSIINMAGTTKFCDVWGCGVISANQSAQKGAKFYAVRGPLTRQALIRTGHECPEIYGDPALLLPKYYEPKTEKKYEIGIIPHYVDYDRVKKEIKDPSIKIIDLTHPSIEEVTDDIFSCKRIISSSLHGVIVSQAYNIPSVWVKLSNKLSGDGIKFADYFLSVGIEPYVGNNYTHTSIPTKKDLISLVDGMSKQNKIKTFDFSELLKSCPFK